jgi:hypothetical protein
VFLGLVRSAGHVLHSGAFGHEMSTHYTETRYAELVFLHLVGFVCHAVHSGASGMQQIDVLFFMPGWDRYRFHKKRVGTCYTKLMFFASDEICGSRSSCLCIRVSKCQCCIFHAPGVRCGFHKNPTGKHYAEHVFLNPVGSTVHVVHFSGSGA